MLTKYVSFSVFMMALVALSYGPSAMAQTSILATQFTTNLSLGSSGTKIIALQKILNQDPDTRIASVGPGSPGNETDYFGQLTKAAVIRFQEKYALEILTPAGLTNGNGYVGLYTRVELNSLSGLSADTGISNSSVPPMSTPAPTTPSLATSSIPANVQNPNLKNIDIILADINAVGAKQGLSSTTLATVREKVIERLSTTTDLHAAFLKTVQTSSLQAQSSFTGRVFTGLARAFTAIFMPGHAFAATSIPFGGALLGSYPCDGGVWNIYVQALPPSFVTSLSYITGSQAYLSYNIPATSALLGEYEPGPGACVIGFVPIPSEGVITPQTGSSPL